MNEWDSPELAQEYASKLDQVDWYEHEVNMPSLLRLIPADTKTVLDFGSGPGQFTAKLAERYEVMGADSSNPMVELAAKAYPQIRFVQWDGSMPFPDTPTFDTVFSKLTLHFVQDLSVFAGHIASILTPRGSFVTSVPHPIRTIVKAEDHYHSGGTYLGPIGKYGLSVTMIHRSLQDYVEPFLTAGFMLDGIDEPVASSEQAKMHSLPFEDREIPKRLNIRFTRC